MIRRALAGVLLAVMMLPACTEARESADPPEEKSPAPTAPSMPEIAQDESAAGAEAFVRHYIDVLNYAEQTGSVRELSNAATDSCEACRSYEDVITKIYSDGGFLKGGRWTVANIENEQLDDRIDVFVKVEIADGTFKESRDGEEKASEAETDLLRFSVKRDAEVWQITELVRQEE